MWVLYVSVVTRRHVSPHSLFDRKHLLCGQIVADRLEYSYNLKWKTLNRSSANLIQFEVECFKQILC